MCSVQYTRTHWRRPVLLQRWPQQDAQGTIPPGWCEACGAEVFVMGDRLCGRCTRRRKERMEDEEQSLSKMYPGQGPGGL